ncbi:MAG: SMI1/KNR4 family protein, partial [Myxococcota bacterium]
MNFKERLLARIKPFRSDAELRLKWSRSTKPTFFKKAEAALGQPLPAPLREFYETCDGAQLHIERGEYLAELNFPRLDRVFGGPTGKGWNDQAYRGALWQDDFADLGAEVFDQFKRLRPLLWLPNGRAVCLDRETLQVLHVDRWTLSEVPGLERFYDCCIETLGLQGWESKLKGHAPPSFERDLKRFTEAAKKRKKARLHPDARVAVSCKRLKVSGIPPRSRLPYPRGTVLRVEGSAVAIEFDAGSRAWVKKGAVQLVEPDLYETLVADEGAWPGFLDSANTGSGPWPWELEGRTSGDWSCAAYGLMGLVRRFPEVTAVGLLLDWAEKTPPLERYRGVDGHIGWKPSLGREHFLDPIVLRAIYESMHVGLGGARKR